MIILRQHEYGVKNSGLKNFHLLNREVRNYSIVTDGLIKTGKTFVKDLKRAVTPTKKYKGFILEKNPSILKTSPKETLRTIGSDLKQEFNNAAANPGRYVQERVGESIKTPVSSTIGSVLDPLPVSPDSIGKTLGRGIRNPEKVFYKAIGKEKVMNQVGNSFGVGQAVNGNSTFQRGLAKVGNFTRNAVNGAVNAVSVGTGGVPLTFI